jgi:hypothetical protein
MGHPITGGHKYRDLVPGLGVGSKVKKSYCCEIRVSENLMVKFKANLAESSNEGYGSKGAVLPIMILSSDNIISHSNIRNLKLSMQEK